MVKEGIVLGHKISSAGIEVDRAKVDVIAKLPYPTNIKGIGSFLEHVGFYRRFIKEFSKIARPMTRLLMKDTKFDYSDDCIRAFNILKKNLTSSPVIIAPYWNLDFELICDASNYAVGAELGQRINKKFRPIYYASKTMNDTQEHYTTTKKNFRLYKQDAKPRLIRLENPKLEELNEEAIRDSFLDEHLMEIYAKETKKDPWHADHANFLLSKVMPEDLTYHLRKKLFLDLKHYIWDEPYLFKSCLERITSGQMENTNQEIKRILERTVNGNMKEWADKLDVALWAFRTAYKTPIRNAAGRNRFLQLTKLAKMRYEAYEHSRSYKERTKQWHDARITDKEFKEGKEVLVFNSRLKLFLGKLRTRWYGPYSVTKVFPYGTVEVCGKNGIRFKVNGHRLKNIMVVV
ncbi:reverse transcriptase domain-containing protein [Tanacetum coccineum]